MEKKKEKVAELSDLSKRFLEAMRLLKLSGYKINKEIPEISESTISHIRTGRNEPSKDVLILFLKKYTDINAEWMYTGVGNPKNNEPTITRATPYISDNLINVPYVPISATASFVESMYSVEYDLETYGIMAEDGENLADGEHIIFEVKGDSMIPTIPDGSKILCKRIKEEQWEYVTGVVVVIYKKILTVKRVLKNNLFGGNEIILKADNPIHGENSVQRCEIRAIWQAVRVVSMKIS